jgi:hypothetical protein
LLLFFLGEDNEEEKEVDNNSSNNVGLTERWYFSHYWKFSSKKIPDYSVTIQIKWFLFLRHFMVYSELIYGKP